jgi:hypothetical protein
LQGRARHVDRNATQAEPRDAEPEQHDLKAEHRQAFTAVLPTEQE